MNCGLTSDIHLIEIERRAYGKEEIDKRKQTEPRWREFGFPLLKRLVELGAPQADFVFREEIVRRFNSGNLTVALYLLEKGYLELLDNNDLQYCFLDSNKILKEQIKSELEKENIFNISVYILLVRLKRLGDKFAKELIENDPLTSSSVFFIKLRDHLIETYFTFQDGKISPYLRDDSSIIPINPSERFRVLLRTIIDSQRLDLLKSIEIFKICRLFNYFVPLILKDLLFFA